jgi:hypothetical protein
MPAKEEFQQGIRLSLVVTDHVTNITAAKKHVMILEFLSYYLFGRWRSLFPSNLARTRVMQSYNRYLTLFVVCFGSP